MKKVLLFDFDGTIADSFESFINIVGALSIKHKLPVLTQSELEQLRFEEPRAIIKRLKIPFYKIPFLARDMKKMQYEHLQHIKPYKGLPEVLHEIQKRGYELGIITSNGKENVQRFLHLHNIDFFKYIYTDTSMFGKDRVLRKFIKDHDMTKEQVMYIGDEIRDIQACIKAGVRIAAVTWGFNVKEGLQKHNPDFLIDNPNDLLQVFDILK